METHTIDKQTNWKSWKRVDRTFVVLFFNFWKSFLFEKNRSKCCVSLGSKLQMEIHFYLITVIKVKLVVSIVWSFSLILFHVWFGQVFDQLNLDFQHHPYLSKPLFRKSRKLRAWTKLVFFLSIFLIFGNTWKIEKKWNK